eukprot:gene11619-13502_t
MSFKIASRFQEAAKVVNGIPVDKFPLLLNRIIQKLHLKTAYFSAEEEEQLKPMLKLNDKDLKTTLDCCSYIYEQAAFSSTGPEPLFEILLEAGFDEAHAKVLGRTWATEASEYIARLKAVQTMGQPSSASLVSTDYHLNLVLAQGALSRQQEPTALFEFSFAGGEKSAKETNESGVQESGNLIGSGEDKLCVEFNHEELFSFFNQLERMQKQIDALGTA